MKKNKANIEHANKENNANKNKDHKKIYQTVLDIDNKYPVTLILIYFYIIFICLLLGYMYILVISVAYRPEWHVEKLGSMAINATCSIILIISIAITALFIRTTAPQLKLWIDDRYLMIMNVIPKRVARTLFLILMIIALWEMNQFIKQVMPIYLINSLVKNTINEFSRWGSIITSLIIMCIQFIAINIPDLKVSYMYNHKIITDYKVKNGEDNSQLILFGTNKGGAKATYEVLGICSKKEKIQLNNNILKSKLIQPQIFFRESNKPLHSAKNRVEVLDKNESMPTYYLNFEKFPVEDFFIVFLEWPNKLIFVPVYVKEDEIKFPILGKKSTGNWIMCALVGIAIILKWGESQARNKIYKEKFEYINGEEYQILPQSYFKKDSTYNITGVKLKLKNIQYVKSIKNNKFNCFIELETNKNSLMYFTQCQAVTKQGRKFNANIKTIYQYRQQNKECFEILVDVNNIGKNESINQINISCLNGRSHEVEIWKLETVKKFV